MDHRALAVRRMQEYIRDHLSEEITADALAAACAYSPSRARALFRDTLGLTPAGYIRRLRLSNSALRLRDERCRVLDVAMELGFGSEDGYQRAFRKEFGCNPREYARSPVPLWLFTPYLVSTAERKEKNMNESRTVFVQVIEKPERKVILKRARSATEYWSYCNEVGCDVWGLLKSIRSLSGEPVCLWLPEKYRDPLTNEYVQGVEVDTDYTGPVPDGFDVITLPAASFLLFRGEPFRDEDFEEAIQEIWNAEKKYDPSFIGYEPDPENPRIQLEPVAERGYIEMLPVRRK